MAERSPTSDRDVLLHAPRINWYTGFVLVVAYLVAMNDLASSKNLPLIGSAVVPLPVLVAGLWLLQRPLARLELQPSGIVERTWLRRRTVVPRDRLAGTHIRSRRAWGDGLALFWTKYDYLVFETTSGEMIEARRYWRYMADPILGSDVTRAAARLRGDGAAGRALREAS